MKVLLIRLSAMGDIVFASPLIQAFRHRYPDAHIAWLVAQPFASLLNANTELDDVIVLPISDWRCLVKERRFLALFRAVNRFRRELRANKFDFAIDLQGLFKSGIWAWLSRAEVRVGLGSREGSQHFMTRVIDRQGGRPDRIGSEYLYLAEQMGLEPSGFSMQVAVSHRSRACAKQLITETVGALQYGVICPFTTRPQKHWLNERWAELVPMLVNTFGMPVLILGGPGDREEGEAIAGAKGAVNLAGRTDLQVAASIISDSSYVIGVDTGLTHMGISFRRPTICLFGSTRPYTDTAIPEGRVLFHDLPCTPCRRHPTCAGRFDCMRAITVQEVLTALQEKMEEAGEF